MIEEYINSKVTGGHYAFRNEGSKTAFTNKFTEAMLVDLKSTDIVADIGAYVGEYSLYCASQGVKEIRSYEPTPNTFRLLSKNKKKNMSVYNMAVVGDDSENVMLHTSSGIGVTNSISKKLRKKNAISVPAIRYEDAVKDATVVKIDVEGAEYSYNIVQPHIRAYILEFHPMNDMNWKGRAFEIMNEIESNGFTPLAKPEFKHGWDLHGAWVRNDNR